MKQILRLVVKEYRLFIADKVALGLTFIVPVILTAIFGAVFGGTSAGPRGIRLAFVNESSSPIATSIEEALDTTKAVRLLKTFRGENTIEQKFDSLSAKEYVQKGSASAALIIPADIFSDTSLGLKVKFFYDPKNDIEMQMLKGIVQRTMYSQLGNLFPQMMQKQTEKFLGADSGGLFNREMALLISEYFEVDTNLILHPNLMAWRDSSETTSDRPDFFADLIRIDETQLVGQKVTNPWATRSVGGWAMMFLLFTLTGSATSLFDEKKSGVVLRLLASPISRIQILWSKYLFNVSLGVVQLVFLFIVGWLMFDINVFPNFFNLLLIITAAAIACTAFGMMLAAFCRTTQQASGWGTLLILSMSSIGGAWFPVSFMPEYIQFFSKLTIIYWSMDGFLEVLWRGVGILSILPNIGILLGIAALVNVVSVIQFKKGHVF
ncbi:MAG: ABC transporter permease [Ignavibacteriae bacterium]|nr:ABC transporter permease [Ignavibacteriota bacterium]